MAWIHQSCPGETESIHHLLQHVDKVDRRALETRIMTGATEGVSGDHDDVIMILCPYIQVCRPLKSRVEQILVSEGSPVTLYRLTNLIR